MDRALLRQIILVIAAVFVAVPGFIAGYASCNNWQWRFLKQAAVMHEKGSQDASDFSGFFADRLAVWRLCDSIPLADLERFDVVSVEAGLMPLGGPLVWARPQMIDGIPAPIALGTVGLIWLIGAAAAAYAGVGMGRWVFLRDLVSEVARLPAVRTAWRGVALRAVACALVAGPVLGGLTWYLGFDRSQNTRFVADSFVPTWGEWALATALLLATSAGLAGAGVRRAALKATTDADRWEGRACRGCGYEIGTLAVDRCPECGRHLVNGGTPRRPRRMFWVTLTAGVCVTIVGSLYVVPPLLERIGVLSRYQFQTQPFGTLWVRMGWGWITLRGDAYSGRDRPGRCAVGDVMEISTREGRGWLTVRSVRTPGIDPRDGSGTGFVAAWLWQPEVSGAQVTAPAAIETGMDLFTPPSTDTFVGIAQTKAGDPRFDFGSTLVTGGMSFARNGLLEFHIYGLPVLEFRRYPANASEPNPAAEVREAATRLIAERGLELREPPR